MKRLISNTSFGKYCKSKEKEFSRRINYLDWYERVRNNFDNFLEQQLKLEMFVPCDEEGNVISKFYSEKENTKNLTFSQLSNQYQIAETKVLFENIPIAQAKWLVNTFSTIESLSDISNTITPIYLTESAIKQIGL